MKTTDEPILNKKNQDNIDDELKKFEEDIRIKILIEIFHNMFLMKNNVYFEKYPNNAEELDRDLKLYYELKNINNI